MYQTSLEIMHNVVNTDTILSVPNVTDVPNVNTVPTYRKWPISILVYQKYLIYQLVYCTNRCTKRQVYQSAPNVPKLTRMPSVLNTDPILSMPNVTGVPNVPTTYQTCRKWPRMIRLCQKATWCTNKTTTNTLSVPTGVPNVKCAKVHQMYQNS